jgi:uncharacterized protein
MAINMEREPNGLPIEDDPMYVVRRENGGGPVARIGDPAPLGLAAFGLTLLLFSMFATGLLSTSGQPVVLGMAVAGGAVQVLAGMWEVRRGNAFGATTFASYGVFWLAYWVLEQFYIGTIPAAERGNALGLYFIAWAIFTVLLWVASTRTTAVASLMLALLAVSLVLLGIGEAGAHSEIVKVGGWFGLAATAAALYGAFAGAVNGTYARTLLPLVPLQRHRTAG